MTPSKASTFTSEADISPNLISNITQEVHPLLQRGKRGQLDMSTVTKDLSTLAGDRGPNKQEQRFIEEIQALPERHRTIDAALDRATKLDRRVQSAGPVASGYKQLSSTLVSVLEQAAGEDPSAEAMGSDERTVAIITGTVAGFVAGMELGGPMGAIIGGVGVGLTVAATTEDEGTGSGESEEGESDEEGDTDGDTGGEDTGGGGDTGR